MNNLLDSFLSGVIIVIIGLAALLFFTGHTADKTQRRIHQEAVSLGYGQWIVNTNALDSGIAPTTTFQWITNNIQSK
jgi:hypothetical protein